MYGLQRPTKENIPTSPVEIIQSSRTDQTNPIHSSRSNISSNKQTKLLRFYKKRARETQTNVISKPAIYRTKKKYYEKPF
jgi:hypothetical protein